ncbi:hypothetical protein [Paenibacillus hexagrammi]|uniref:Uncharacterized protein n=1 Tax=Paenibacillus hexagrammi TaxID=2908839 RepID=A0ABY3SDN7_9BACL|nr:hypothetical protein [Paenibacillus sp. YPD9-1]UJF32103.1 hypothetical protein L0M14_20545 [Paenibacillus sp. YPD9-1]
MTDSRMIVPSKQDCMSLDQWVKTQRSADRHTLLTYPMKKSRSLIKPISIDKKLHPIFKYA